MIVFVVVCLHVTMIMPCIACILVAFTLVNVVCLIIMAKSLIL